MRRLTPADRGADTPGGRWHGGEVSELQQNTQGSRAQSRSDTGFFGQPRVLANLFGVELWERFSFYGMQGILLIYLYYSAAEGGLGIDEAVATGIVGAYGGAVYLSTILGAWLADRLIGPERTLFYAAICVMAGHIALAVCPDLAGVGLGLVLIALGSGGVKANATSLVGSLYDEHDARRDAGFSLFYMGINIGALLGPLLTGLLQKEAGFHWGFAPLRSAWRSASPSTRSPQEPPGGDPPRRQPAAGGPARGVRRRRRGRACAGRRAGVGRGDHRRTAGRHRHRHQPARRDRLLRADPLRQGREGRRAQPDLRVHPAVRLQRRCSGRSTSSSSPS